MICHTIVINIRYNGTMNEESPITLTTPISAAAEVDPAARPQSGLAEDMGGFATRIAAQAQNKPGYGFMTMEAAKEILFNKSPWFRFDETGRLTPVAQGKLAPLKPLTAQQMQLIQDLKNDPAQAIAQAKAQDGELSPELLAAQARAAQGEEMVEDALGAEGNPEDDTYIDPESVEEIAEDMNLSPNRRAILQSKLRNALIQRQLLQAEQIEVLLDAQEYDEKLAELKKLAEDARDAKPAAITAMPRATAMAPTTEEMLERLEAAAQFYADRDERLAVLRELRAELTPAMPSPAQWEQAQGALQQLLRTQGVVASAVTLENGVMKVNPHALAMARDALQGKFQSAPPNASSQN